MSATDSSFSFNSTSDADSTGLLDQWFEIHPLSCRNAKWDNTEFNDFMATLRYPSFTKSKQVAQLIDSLLPENQCWNSNLYRAMWNARIRDEQLEDEDRYDFQTWFMYILGSWVSFWRNFEREEGSAACKKGVESLIELAFRPRKQAWLPDEEIALPDEPDAVKADSVVVMDLPKLWKRPFVITNDQYFNLSWSYRNKPESIITFAFIASETHPHLALRKLQMCFYSAQMHRRALCCKDGPVFGATLVKEDFRVYVSFWDGQTLNVRPILRRYSFGCYSAFVESYFALCRISEYQAEFLEKEFERWEVDSHPQYVGLELSCEQPWRKAQRGQLESLCEYYGGVDCISESFATGASETRSHLADDRKTMQIIGSIRRGIYPSQKRYPLTQTHKRAFDILTNSGSSEETRSSQSLSVWAEEAERHKGEYEDPAPYFACMGKGDSLAESCSEADENSRYDKPSDRSLGQDDKTLVEVGVAGTKAGISPISTPTGLPVKDTEDSAKAAVTLDVSGNTGTTSGTIPESMK